MEAKAGGFVSPTPSQSHQHSNQHSHPHQHPHPHQERYPHPQEPSPIATPTHTATGAAAGNSSSATTATASFWGSFTSSSMGKYASWMGGGGEYVTTASPAGAYPTPPPPPPFLTQPTHHSHQQQQQQQHSSPATGHIPYRYSSTTTGGAVLMPYPPPAAHYPPPSYPYPPTHHHHHHSYPPSTPPPSRQEQVDVASNGGGNNNNNNNNNNMASGVRSFVKGIMGPITSCVQPPHSFVATCAGIGNNNNNNQNSNSTTAPYITPSSTREWTSSMCTTADDDAVLLVPTNTASTTNSNGIHYRMETGAHNHHHTMSYHRHHHNPHYRYHPPLTYHNHFYSSSPHASTTAITLPAVRAGPPPPPPYMPNATTVPAPYPPQQKHQQSMTVDETKYDVGGAGVVVFHPHENDVLCGRGGSSNRHLGNMRFRALIAANKAMYSRLTKKQKMNVARQIVDLVRYGTNPPGRFLAKTNTNNKSNAAGSYYYQDIGLLRSLEKTSQALRERGCNKKDDEQTQDATNDEDEQEDEAREDQEEEELQDDDDVEEVALEQVEVCFGGDGAQDKIDCTAVKVKTGGKNRKDKDKNNNIGNNNNNKTCGVYQEQMPKLIIPSSLQTVYVLHDKSSSQARPAPSRVPSWPYGGSGGCWGPTLATDERVHHPSCGVQCHHPIRPVLSYSSSTTTTSSPPLPLPLQHFYDSHHHQQQQHQEQHSHSCRNRAIPLKKRVIASSGRNANEANRQFREAFQPPPTTLSKRESKSDDKDSRPRRLERRSVSNSSATSAASTFGRTVTAEEADDDDDMDVVLPTPVPSQGQIGNTSPLRQQDWKRQRTSKTPPANNYSHGESHINNNKTAIVSVSPVIKRTVSASLTQDMESNLHLEEEEKNEKLMNRQEQGGEDLLAPVQVQNDATHRIVPQSSMVQSLDRLSSAAASANVAVPRSHHLKNEPSNYAAMEGLAALSTAALMLEDRGG